MARLSRFSSVDVVAIGDTSYEWVQRVKDLSRGLHWPADPDEWLRAPDVTSKRGLVFFVHWSYRVPTHILKEFECVNFHCTPLPYGRGGHPIENMIIRGHSKTTMTAHRMVEALDAGPIYSQRSDISLEGSKADILSRFVEPVISLIDEIIAEPEIKLVDQSAIGQPTIFRRLTPDEYAEFWSARQ